MGCTYGHQVGDSGQFDVRGKLLTACSRVATNRNTMDDHVPCLYIYTCERVRGYNALSLEGYDGRGQVRESTYRYTVI
jgi:hypothetical protein